MHQLDELRKRYTISDAWHDEGFEHRPAKSCRSPFRNDRKASFSVFANDTQWKDHANGQSGDVFSFLQIARNCSFRDAVEIAKKRAGGVLIANRKQRSRNSTQPQQIYHNKLRCIPTPVHKIWNDGQKHSEQNLRICERVDSWRQWPAGTAAKLLCDDLISFPQTQSPHTTQAIAFPVCGNVASNFSQIGMHMRVDAQRAYWQFLPNKKAHKTSIPPLPFILGHGHLTNADLVIITEGQWDCVSLAAWMGWLDHDTAWPMRITTMGILGASNWKTALKHFKWPKSAAVALIPDNDQAGNAWKGDFLAELKNCSRKVSVFQPNQNDLSDQIATTKNKPELLTQMIERAIA